MPSRFATDSRARRAVPPPTTGSAGAGRHGSGGCRRGGRCQGREYSAGLMYPRTPDRHARPCRHAAESSATVTIAPWEYLFDAFEQRGFPDLFDPVWISSLVLLIDPDHPLQRPDEAAPRARSVPEPLRVAAVGRPVGVRPADRRGDLQVLVHPRADHRGRRAGRARLDPVREVPAGARARTSGMLARQRYVLAPALRPSRGHGPPEARRAAAAGGSQARRPSARRACRWRSAGSASAIAGRTGRRAPRRRRPGHPLRRTRGRLRARVPARCAGHAAHEPEPRRGSSSSRAAAGSRSATSGRAIQAGEAVLWPPNVEHARLDRPADDDARDRRGVLGLGVDAGGCSKGSRARAAVGETEHVARGDGALAPRRTVVRERGPVEGEPL